MQPEVSLSISMPFVPKPQQCCSSAERICQENDLIQQILENGSAQALAYRRVDAKIGWPLKIA